MKKITSSIVALTMATFASNAVATDAIVCSGQVDQVAIYSTDLVTMKLSGMNTTVAVCSLSSTVGTSFPVGAAQCKAAYGILLAAMASDKPVTVWLDNVRYGTSCTNLTRLEIATLRWVELNR